MEHVENVREAKNKEPNIAVVGQSRVSNFASKSPHLKALVLLKQHLNLILASKRKL